ncbi:MAG TPA: hypothetical protein VFG62_09120 [Rhodopila sp.]|nr:hypothetical protein [Rhodopila sp.]
MKRSSYETSRAKGRRRAASGPLLASALALSCLVAQAAFTLPAFAQTPPPDTDSHVQFDAPGFLPKKGRSGLPNVKASPLAWPRLDRGSVLCRSEEDLSRLAARRRGQSVEGPIDCQIVRAATGVSILRRQGPGMTEVQTNDPNAGGTGWTDAWLPERPPPH